MGQSENGKDCDGIREDRATVSTSGSQGEQPAGGLKCAGALARGAWPRGGLWCGRTPLRRRQGFLACSRRRDRPAVEGEFGRVEAELRAKDARREKRARAETRRLPRESRGAGPAERAERPEVWVGGDNA